MKIEIDLPEKDIVDTYDYIYDYWEELVMRKDSFVIPLPNNWVRPSGFFKMFFYWDSYFIILGLIAQGKYKLALGNLENIFFLIGKFGFVPNYVGKKYVIHVLNLHF